MKIIDINCWICNGEYEYFYNKEYEERGWYCFKCKKCEDIILMPKDSPILKFIEE